MDITSVLQSCFDSGVVLTVLDDGKLSIKGNKAAPAVTELKAWVQRDRAAVIALLQTPLQSPEPEVKPGFYRRSYGAIAAYTGQTLTPADALFEVTDTSPLHQTESAGYKKWLWDKMQTDAAVLAELYEISNLGFVGCNTFVKGSNAAAIAAAATFELNRAKLD